MLIKIHTKPKGIPAARLVVTHGEEDSGAKRINLMQYAVDALGFGEVATSLRMSPDEALDGGARTIVAALTGKTGPDAEPDVQALLVHARLMFTR